MFRNISITYKIFIGFFVASTLSILFMMTTIYFGVSGSIIEARVKRLETVRDITIKKLSDTINMLGNPLLYFIASNHEAYKFDELAKLYYELSSELTKEQIDKIDSDLNSYFDRKYKQNIVLDYLKLQPSDAVPKGVNGKIAQYISIKGLNKDTSIFRSEVINKYLAIDHILEDQLHNLLKIDGVENILFISKDDDIFYSSKKNSSIGHNIINSSWMTGLSAQISAFHNINPMFNKQYFIVDMVPCAPLNGAPVFFIAVPIFEDHVYQGSIVLVISSDFIDNILSNDGHWDEGLGETGDLYVTNSNGVMRSNRRQFILHKDEYIDYLRKMQGHNNTYELVEYLNTTAYYSKILRKLPARSDSKPGNIVSKTINGKEAIIYYSPLSLGNLQWIVCISMEESEIYTDLLNMRRLMVNLSIPVLIVLFTITVAFSYLISRSIKQLKDSCLRVASGNLDYINIDSSYKELNEFIDSFNTMIRNLKYYEIENQESRTQLEKAIAQHVETSKELTVEKDFITKLLDVKGLAIFVLDEDGFIVRTNTVFLRHVGATNLVGVHYESIIPDEYKRRVITLISDLKEGKEAPYFITRLITSQEYYVEWNFSMLSEQNQEPNHTSKFIVAIGIDVTDRYKAQKSLQENEALVQRIFNSAYDAILISDAKNNVLMINKAFETLLGYNFMEIVGQSVIGTIFAPEYEVLVLSDTDEGQTIEIEAIKGSGDKMPIDLSISRIKYQGETSILYILRDASSRRKREKDLKEALDKAKDAEKAKGEFLASMSHEIRTPLDGIMGFLDLLRDTNLDAVQQEYLKIITSSSDNLFSIINDVLDFSKIESGRLQLENTEFDSWGVFEESAAIYAAKAIDKSITLMVVFSTDIPRHVKGDPIRIRQIITNLISNSVKFTDKGGKVIVRVSAVFDNSITCKLRISVRDSGAGIPEEQQKEIIDAFACPDVSVVKESGGIGLGLNIANSLVRAMNSTMNLHSVEGKGSEFYFSIEFPIVTINDPNEYSYLNNLPVALYSEDNKKSLQDIYEEYITDLKCDCTIYSDMEKIKENKDIKIICVNYEEHSPEKIQQLIDMYSSIPVIVLSSICNNKEAMHLYGDNYYPLVSPLGPTKFMDTIHAALQQENLKKNSVKKSKLSKLRGKVLLVDDNDVNSKLSEILLKNIGLTVDTAENGQVALSKVKDSRYDLIFMDAYMPVMDGVEASKAIIEYEKSINRIHTPIIALTANVVESDIENYIMTGMDDFIAKPIVKNKLKDIIEKHLAHGEQESNPIVDEVKAFLKETDTNKAKQRLVDYCILAWEDINNLVSNINKSSEAGIYEILNKVETGAKELNLEHIISTLDKIKSNIQQGMNKNIITLIDDLKRALYNLKRQACS